MKVRPHPRYPEFVYRITRVSPSPAPWSGVTFRSVNLEHATPDDIISGQGSFLYGGRWNAPETFPVIVRQPESRYRRGGSVSTRD